MSAPSCSAATGAEPRRAAGDPARGAVPQPRPNECRDRQESRGPARGRQARGEAPAAAGGRGAGAVVSFDDASFEELIGLCRTCGRSGTRPPQRSRIANSSCGSSSTRSCSSIATPSDCVAHRLGRRQRRRSRRAHPRRLHRSTDHRNGRSGAPPEAIAARLNELGIRTLRGRPWDRHTVAQSPALHEAPRREIPPK